jgi:drug/metabolite transporter (DMT)-like permease
MSGMLMSRRAVADLALLVLVNAMWAGQYAAYKTVSEKMGPVTVGAWTFLIASLVLIPFLVLERSRARVPEKQSVPAVSSARSLKEFVVLGVLGLVAASALTAWGTGLSTASNASLIALTIPIITALLASLILHEKMTRLRWLSLFVSLTGVLILSDFDWRHPDLASGKYLVSNILILGGCAASSFYNVYSKKLLRRFSPLEVLIYGYLIALVVSLPLLFSFEGFSLAAMKTYTAATWLAIGMLSVFSWGLAMVLWMFLLQRLDVSQASVSIYLLPFLGVLISALTLKEHLTLTMLVGGTITLAGTAIITASEHGAESQTATTEQVL